MRGLLIALKAAERLKLLFRSAQLYLDLRRPCGAVAWRIVFFTYAAAPQGHEIPELLKSAPLLVNCVLSVTGLYFRHAHPADLFRHYARSPEEHNQTQIQFLTIRVCIDIVSLPPKGVGTGFIRADALPPKGYLLNWEIDHEHLSDFWITFIHWQTVNGAVGTVGVNDDVPDAVLTKVERHWTEICLGPKT